MAHSASGRFSSEYQDDVTGFLAGLSGGSRPGTPAAFMDEYGADLFGVESSALRFGDPDSETVPGVVSTRASQVIGDAPVRHYETTKEHAESLGAIAFFGDKYGDLVRVLEAGEHSIELCGGTHVHALGFIGPIKITSEASIGANLRRIFAVTGDTALARIHDEEVQLRQLADSLKVSPAEVPDRVARLG